MEPGLRSVHSIYKIKVRGKVYAGYTSRDPLIRFNEHIETAKRGKWSGNSKIYPALKRNNYECEFEVVDQFDTELQALMEEIRIIHNENLVEEGLNCTRGGEGATLVVRTRIDKSGVLSFKVEKRKGGFNPGWNKGMKQSDAWKAKAAASRDYSAIAEKARIQMTGHVPSEETRQKRSEKMSKKRWYNDGKNNRRLEEHPGKGWFEGQVRNKQKSLKKRRRRRR